MSDLVSTFRWKKMERFFDFMDRDKDGRITVNDFFHNVKYLENTGRGGSKTMRQLKREMMSWWGLYFEDAEEFGGGISKADFVKRNAEYHAEKTSGADLTNHYTLVFDAIDLDGDGRIGVEELMLYYRAHDWTDEDHVRDVFRRLDENGDGYVTRDELIRAAVQFWLSDEPGTDYLY